MTLNDVLYQIRKTDGRPFAVTSVRSTGKTQGSVKKGVYIFADFIDTNRDILKVRQIEPEPEDHTKILKISHLITFNNQLIIHK